jgi:tetratricopeptide (TPR) repeat protein
MTFDAHDLQAEHSVETPSQPDAVMNEVDANDSVLVANTAGEAPAPAPSLWTRLRRSVLPKADERAEDYLRRLRLLDEAIERYPQSPSGYVLRGELHLSAGMIDPALRDFRQGLTLAERQLYTEQWGLVAQVMRDRAREGLTQALSLKR